MSTSVKTAIPAIVEPFGRLRYTYVCTTCGRHVSTQQALSNHEKVHTDERPFECPRPFCTKRFIQFANLESHMRRHLGEKPYSCILCKLEGADHTFTTSTGLRAHKIRHHGTVKQPSKRHAPSVFSVAKTQPILFLEAKEAPLSPTLLSSPHLPSMVDVTMPPLTLPSSSEVYMGPEKKSFRLYTNAQHKRIKYTFTPTSIDKVIELEVSSYMNGELPATPSAKRQCMADTPQSLPDLSPVSFGTFSYPTHTEEPKLVNCKHILFTPETKALSTLEMPPTFALG